MLAGNWFGKKRTDVRTKRSHRPLKKGVRRKDATRHRDLRVEELEDRRMLATYVVNNLGDLDADGNVVVGSLRQAIQLSNASQDTFDQIVFADFLFTDPATRVTTPQTILLDTRENGRQLSITDEVEILGPGASTLQIANQAGSTFRLFNINIDSDEQVRPVTIGGVTLGYDPSFGSTLNQIGAAAGGNLIGTEDSDDNRGGAFINREALTLIETIVAGNFASWGGGAIYSPIGGVFSERSLFLGNRSGGGGGAILLGDEDDEVRPNVTISNSTFFENSSFSQFERPGYGGAIFNRSGNLTVQHSTLVGNSAPAGGGAVATNGIADIEGDVQLITTSLTHSILVGNTGLPTLDDPTDNSDDLFPVRSDIEGNPLAPTLNLNLGGGYNFIGHIGGAALRGNPNDPNEPTNPIDDRRFNFYEVVSAPDGIDWVTANQFTNFGGPNSIHLASISGNAPSDEQDPFDPLAEAASENDFVFSIVDSEQYWNRFEPTTPMDNQAPPRNIGPWLGGLQAAGGPEQMADADWEWVTTDNDAMPNPIDPWEFTAWAPGQPDDGEELAEPPAEGEEPDLEPENRLAFFTVPQEAMPPDPPPPPRQALWGDLVIEPPAEQSPIAYIIEYEKGNNFFGVDPLLTELGDFGGATPVFYPDSFSGSPLIDAGDPQFASNGIEQRGIHFTRVANGTIDIGAVEVQNGVFTVDTLFDETDGQYTVAFGQDGVEFPLPASLWYQTRGDFALREALEFSEKNPEFDTINFSTNLLGLDDPTASPAPTILLKLSSGAGSAFNVSASVDVFGPSGFELELDAAGNDLTPTVNNSDGTRIFSVDNGDASFNSQVFISNLTLLGGDVVGEGGAILNREELFLDNLSIKENFASVSGGGVASLDGDLFVASSALFNNNAGFEGGALKLGGGTPGSLSTAIVSNSTISGNEAARGAGILNEDGELLIEFSTITDNTGPIGAGVANLNNPNTFTQISSSIISANVLGEDVRILQSAVPNVQSLGFNLIGNSNALNVFNQPGDQPGVINPMISSLVIDGGFTPVHRLLPGSPAIDAGESTAVAGVGNVPTYDQRGLPFTRVFDGVQDTKDRIDIGAYELQGTTFLVDNPIDEDDGITSTGFLSLREAIDLANANPLPDFIMFDPVLMAGQTILQSSKNGGLLQPGTPSDIRITDSVTIVGLGEGLLTLQGGASVDANVFPPIGEPFQIARFFTIDDGDNANDIEVNMSGLTFTGSTGVTDVGAVIKSSEKLSISESTFTSNSTFGEENNGGAIYQRYGQLTLDGVTLTANTTDGVDADGGAVYVRDANATVQNSIISGNSTSQTLGSGGGFYIRGGTLDMAYSTVAGNLAPGGEADGAGLFGYESTLNINNSYITGNSMTGSNSEGAGIFSKDSSLTITDSFVSLNSTTGTQSEGAGIYLSGGNATINRTSVSINSTSGLVATGGGIAVVDGDLLILASTVTGNSTSGNDASGGGIHNLGGEVTILDSTISGNTTSGLRAKGGGVYSSTTLGSNEKTEIINSTVSGNSSPESGGGIFNARGLTDIRHSTVTNNSVPFFGKGGGVASFGTAATTSTLVYSSIIAGNFASGDPGNPISDVDSPEGNGQNTFVSQGYNVIGRGLPLALNGFNAVGDQTLIDDPILGLLTFNGGPTFTHAPLENSPVINRGNPADVAGSGSVPEFDQRGTGFPRVLAGQIDVGAVESPFNTAPSADFDEDGDVDGSDFLAWQRGFGTVAASKSDGDANSDGNVNTVDLAMWQSAYGGVSTLAASSTGGDNQLAASSHAESEPPTAAAVLSAESVDPVLDALIARTLEVRSDADDVAVQAPQAAEQVVVRDQLFAALSRRGEYRDDDGVDQLTAESSENDLEVTLEDRIFDLLGA